jgi:hypothetical protein
MGHLVRMQVVSRISYYLGWIALGCGALVHLKIGQALFLALSMTKRNLFELSVVCFLICIASELRTSVPTEQAKVEVIKRAPAA